MGFVALCICQICTCGRHRCPHNNGSIGIRSKAEKGKPECKITEYKHAYRGGPFQPPRKSIRPRIQKEPCSDRKDMDMATTYAIDFVTYKVKPRCNPPKMKHKPKVVPPMDMTTTYGTDFSEKKGERLKPIKPKSDIRQNNSWTSKKACKTVHQLTFLKYDEESLKNCRPAAVRKKDNMVWPKKPFNAISTVQADFVEHLGAERRQPIKPDVRERVSGAFNDSTTYRHEYTPKENHGFAYVRPRDEYKPNPEKFSAVTTAMADFKAHKNVTRARSFKPPQSYVRSSTPFDGRTVKSIVHRAWPAVKPRTPACKQAKFVPPTVGFAKTSSYMDDYKKFSNCPRTLLIRPHSEDTKNLPAKKDAFQGVSTYAENFISYPGAERSKSFKKRVVWAKPKQMLLGESIMKSHYTGECASRSEICRPKIRSTDKDRKPMSFETTYSAQYTGESNTPCPVADINKPNSLEHSFNKNGHMFYVPEEKGATTCDCSAADDTECQKNETGANCEGSCNCEE